MTGHGVRVYCAGPLFNAKEQDEMRELADMLRRAGYDVFLPQEDGLELTKVVEALVAEGVEPNRASAVCARAIFALDVYQVIKECDAIVVNLNGRVPDEGAVSEAAIAWSNGKAVVGYKADSRSVFMGNDNPLVTGLFNFELCQTFDEVLLALKAELEKHSSDEGKVTARIDEIAEYLHLGGLIWNAAHHDDDKVASVTQILLREAGRTPSGGGHEIAQAV